MASGALTKLTSKKVPLFCPPGCHAVLWGLMTGATVLMGGAVGGETWVTHHLWSLSPHSRVREKKLQPSLSHGRLGFLLREAVQLQTEVTSMNANLRYFDKISFLPPIERQNNNTYYIFQYVKKRTY